MNKKVVVFFVILLFLLCFGTRLYIAFQTPYFDVGNAYFTQRQVESILEKGIPNYNDLLSFSGKEQIFMPLYYYILAGFSFLMPLSIAGKIIPNLFASLIVFLSFLLAKKITKNDPASLLTAFMSAFIPVFFVQTVNSMSPYSLLIPLMLYQSYCFLTKKFAQFTVLCFVIPLIHFSAVVFPLGLLLFILLSKIERFKIERPYVEMTIFSLVIYLWLLLVFYKRAVLFHGFSIVFKNIPTAILSQHFAEFSMVQGIYLVGVIPFIYGVFSIYEFLFKKRVFEGFFMIALVFTPAILLWLTLIEVTQGMIFFGVFLTILFSGHYEQFASFIKRSRFSQLKYYKYYFVFSSITFFIITSAIPSFVLSEKAIDSSLSEEEHIALLWIKENTPEDSVILASLQEGDVIAALAKRKNVMDANFLLVKNINLRYTELNKMFSSPYSVETIRLMNKYDVKYVYLSQRNKDASLEKFSDKCFDNVFSNEKARIYEVKCKLTE